MFESKQTLICPKWNRQTISITVRCMSAVSDVVSMSGRTGKWITCLIEGLDEHVDEKTRAVILEKCGRQCQSQSFIKKAKAIYKESEDTEDFLKKLGHVYKHLEREGNNVYIAYRDATAPR